MTSAFTPAPRFVHDLYAIVPAAIDVAPIATKGHALRSATGRNPRQRFPPVRAVFGAVSFATGCHGLRPLGSINAPISWPGCGLTWGCGNPARALR